MPSICSKSYPVYHSCPELNQLVSSELCNFKTLTPTSIALTKSIKSMYAQMLKHTGEGINPDDDEPCANKLCLFSCSSLLLVLTVDYLEEILDVFP